MSELVWRKSCPCPNEDHQEAVVATLRRTVIGGYEESKWHVVSASDCPGGSEEILDPDTILVDHTESTFLVVTVQDVLDVLDAEGQ